MNSTTVIEVYKAELGNGSHAITSLDYRAWDPLVVRLHVSEDGCELNTWVFSREIVADALAGVDSDARMCVRAYRDGAEFHFHFESEYGTGFLTLPTWVVKRFHQESVDACRPNSLAESAAVEKTVEACVNALRVKVGEGEQ